MRFAVLAVVALVSVADKPVQAQTVTFDFAPLPILAGDPIISDYMTTIYGSPITTDGARASRDRTDDATDVFISTSLQLLNRGDFEILFGEVPISGAQFEGHVIDATPGDDFTFLAFSDSTLIFQLDRNDGVEIFDSGWLDFGEPVNRLVFSDSGRKDVGIDDLTVMPVPEPTCALLLLIGGVATLRRRRA